MTHPHRATRIALAILGWFNLVSAIAGMLGLTLGGGMGIPLEWISGSVFTTYFWPGIILGVVVGGSQACAVIAQHGRYALAWGMHVAAGMIMMIWIFVEIAIMLVWSPLHGIYFRTGAIQTVLAVLALGAWPSPFLRRDVGRSSRPTSPRNSISASPKLQRRSRRGGVPWGMRVTRHGRNLIADDRAPSPSDEDLTVEELPLI